MILHHLAQDVSASGAAIGSDLVLARISILPDLIAEHQVVASGSAALVAAAGLQSRNAHRVVAAQVGGIDAAIENARLVDHGVGSVALAVYLPIGIGDLISIGEALAAGALALPLIIYCWVLLAHGNLLSVIAIEEVDSGAGASPILEVNHVCRLLYSHGRAALQLLV